MSRNWGLGESDSTRRPGTRILMLIRVIRTSLEMFSQNSAEINNNETGDMLSEDPGGLPERQPEQYQRCFVMKTFNRSTEQKVKIVFNGIRSHSLVRALQMIFSLKNK